MKVTILGTAAAEGIPALFCNCETCRRARAAGGRDYRTRTQALIDDDLVIDFPPETFVHLSQAGTDASGIRTVLVTHTHSDHFYPTELFNRNRAYAHNPTAETVDFYGSAYAAEYAAGIFGSKALAGRVRFRSVRPYETFAAGRYTVTALPAIHTHPEQSLLYLIESDDGALLWGTDSAYFGGDYGILAFLARRGVKLDMVCLDCTRALCEPDPGRHMNAVQVAALVGEMRGLGLTDERSFVTATHFSHNGGATYDDLCAFFAPHGIEVAYDGMCVEVSGKVRPRFFDAETFSVYKTSSM